MPIDRKAIKKLSNSEYHRRCSVSKSHLDKVNQSPLHFWHHYLDPDRPEPERTKAMILGSAFHTKILEPHLFDKEYLTLVDMDLKLLLQTLEQGVIDRLAPIGNRQAQRMMDQKRFSNNIRLFEELCQMVNTQIPNNLKVKELQH